MQLTRQEARQLRDALIEAFPSRSAFEQMVRFGLELPRPSLSDGPTLEGIAFELLKWAEANDRVQDLLDAAKQGNPTNPALDDIVKAIHQRVSAYPLRAEVTPAQTSTLQTPPPQITSSLPPTRVKNQTIEPQGLSPSEIALILVLICASLLASIPSPPLSSPRSLLLRGFPPVYQ